MTDILMSEAQRRLVQESFARLAPEADALAASFYARLFEIAPEVKPLFKGDMEAQGKKLTRTLGLAISESRRVAQVVPVLEELGRRHVGYGALQAHYPIVGEALLWAIERQLGPACTPEILAAWAALYGRLSQIMLRAA